MGYCNLKTVGLRCPFSRIIIMKFALPWQRNYCGVDGQHRWVIWPQALLDHSYWWEIISSHSSWNTNLWPPIMQQRSAVIWNYSPVGLLFSEVTFNKHWAIILITWLIPIALFLRHLNCLKHTLNQFFGGFLTDVPGIREGCGLDRCDALFMKLNHLQMRFLWKDSNYL